MFNVEYMYTDILTPHLACVSFFIVCLLDSSFVHLLPCVALKAAFGAQMN